jgi:predicted DNA-binding ribbon-helix-helix protein
MGAPAGLGRSAPIAGSLSKRSVSIAGHRTSISLEPEFWAALEAAAAARGCSLARLIGEVDRAREGAGRNLSSALRVFLLAEAAKTRES